MASSTTVRDLSQARETLGDPQQSKRLAAMPLSRLSELYVRLALGVTFLSAVGDRFGLWGSYGHKHVSWGDFGHFTQYAGMVNSFLPAAMIPAVAWMATIAETALGVALILGIYKRAVASGCAALLLMFALAMSISFGIKAPLDYSVFTASAAAVLLFATLRKQNGAARTEGCPGLG